MKAKHKIRTARVNGYSYYLEMEASCGFEGSTGSAPVSVDAAWGSLQALHRRKGCPASSPDPNFRMVSRATVLFLLSRILRGPEGSIIAAELAPGHSWEIAWDGFYLWRGNWDSHPANPESSFPRPKTDLQRGACGKLPIRHTNLQVAESIEASSF